MVESRRAAQGRPVADGAEGTRRVWPFVIALLAGLALLYALPRETLLLALTVGGIVGVVLGVQGWLRRGQTAAPDLSG